MKRLLIAFALCTFVLTAGSVAAAQSAADNYKSKCQMCHGPNGNGDTPMGKKLNAKDFHSPDVQQKNDDELFKFISDGVSNQGKVSMPGYKGKISDDQIRELVKYVRELGKK